jgi:hypothetical protein
MTRMKMLSLGDGSYSNVKNARVQDPIDSDTSLTRAPFPPRLLEIPLPFPRRESCREVLCRKTGRAPLGLPKHSRAACELLLDGSLCADYRRSKSITPNALRPILFSNVTGASGIKAFRNSENDN